MPPKPSTLNYLARHSTATAVSEELGRGGWKESELLIHCKTNSDYESERAMLWVDLGVTPFWFIL